jgi:hypothetical protein
MEVIIIKMAATPDGLTLECGGHEMVPPGTPQRVGLTVDPTLRQGVAAGDRIEHESGVAVLCNQGGTSSLTIDGSPLTAEDSQSLPASD